MKKKNVFLTFLAAGLILTGSIGGARAYFTTYVEAQGGYPLSMGDETTVEEDFSNWTKHVAITREADSEPVYLRARAFCSAYELTYSDGSGKWTPGGDGYYYYSDSSDLWTSVADTEGEEEQVRAEELLVQILNVPSGEAEQKDFNVVVVYETTPVRYNDAGNPYADWSSTLDNGMVEGGVE